MFGWLAAFALLAARLAVGATALLAFYHFYWKRRKLPPGPTPWPLVGNIHTINANPTGEAHFMQWARDYGPVYTFWLGEQPVVVMTDFAQIFDAFVRDGDAFAGRAQFTEMDRLLKGGTLGVVGTEGAVWREHRRFALRVLRDFGVGRNLMQDKILAELEARFRGLDAAAGPVDLAGVFDLAVGSIINDLLFGYRFHGAHEAEFFELKRLVRDVLANFARAGSQAMRLWPAVFTRLPYFRAVFRETRDKFGALCAFYRRQIDAHAAAGGTPPADFVGAYLRERRRRRAENHRSGDDDDYDSFTIEQLVHLCFDLWVAGQETTSRTLTWCAAYVLHHPRVQSRLHEELDTVIGDPDKLVTVAEKPKLPYTNAVINEVQRLGNIVTINLLHRTTRDVTVAGYSLPKGTCIVPQISAIFHNEEYFEEPLAFKPERFLSDDGKSAIKCDYLIPFGVGKRQCLGEPLARMELFLFTANLFNRYTLAPDEAAGLPSLRRLRGGAAHCPDFRCRVRRRRADPGAQFPG